MGKILGILVSFACLCVSGATFAQTAPTKITGIQVTKLTGIARDNCWDVQDLYLNVTLPNGQIVSANPHVEGIDGNFGGCGAWVVPFPVDITEQGVIFHSEVLACEDEAPFRVELFDEDNDIFNGDDDLILSCDVNALGIDGEFCCGNGTSQAICVVPISDPLALLDSDGDGLSNLEETYGRDINCDGVMTPGIDLFLPQMGANPNHKDLFIEMNWFSGYEPSLLGINEVKAAFAAAPIDAGGISNPDGQLGITLHVDAGSLINDVGPAYTEGGIDFGDPSGAPTNTADLHALMGSIESAQRIGVFRQFLFAPSFSGGFPDPHAGGRSIGNDRIQLERRDGAGIMHELGHALGLLHGGEARASLTDGDPVLERVGRNCKPNHLSVMNYLYGSGIPFETGGISRLFLDFSPSKIPDSMILTTAAGCPSGTCNRRLPLLGDLNETALDETQPLLLNDISAGVQLRHQVFFYGRTNARTRAAIWDPINWDDDPATMGDDLAAPIVNAAVNINYNPLDLSTQGCGDGPPPPNNSDPSEILDNIDEWSAISLPTGRSAFGLLNSPEEETVRDPLPPFDPSRGLETDLAVAATLSTTPITVGLPVTLAIHVANLGPNPASNGHLTVVLPPGVSTTSIPDGCVNTDVRTIECGLATVVSGEPVALRPRQMREYEFAIVVSGSTLLGSSILVTASHDGIDLNTNDDSQVVPLVSMPSFLSFEDITSPWVLSWSGGTPLPTTTIRATSGAHSASLDCGFKQFESAPFSTSALSIVGTVLSLDAWIPSAQNSGWVGELQLFIDIPASGINNLSVGQQSFTGLPRNSWTALQFNLPANVVAALRADVPYARIRLASNVATCGAPVLIDSLRFSGALFERTTPHVPGGTQPVTSSSVLTFDNLSDWTIQTGTVTSETVLKTQGTASMRVSSPGYAYLVSRSFPASALSGVTSRLSFDVRIPELPANYSWFGQMDVFIECPSVGLWNTYVGNQPLQILFDGEFNRVEFALPPSVLAALSGSATDCSFRIGVASNQTYGPVILDRGGFAP